MRVDWDALEAVVERMLPGERRAYNSYEENTTTLTTADQVRIGGEVIAWLPQRLREPYNDAEALAAFDQDTLRALLVAVRAGETMRRSIRCWHTHNLCGIDTRPTDAPCRCPACKAHAAYDRATGRTSGEGE